MGAGEITTGVLVLESLPVADSTVAASFEL